MAVVKEDAEGIFVIAGGYKARPGNVAGYDHAYRMDDAGLKAGDRVKAAHRGGTPTTKVTLESGQVLIWHHDYLPSFQKRTFDYEPEKFNKKGMRDYSLVDVDLGPRPARPEPEQAEPEIILPRPIPVHRFR